MSVADDLLASARRLAQRGRDPITAGELIAEARTAGLANPETTLRTMMHNLVVAGRLVRVGRGRFRLGDDAPATTSPPTPHAGD